MAIPLTTFAIYLPAIVVPYATSDDFSQLAAERSSPDSLWHHYFWNGRPLGAALVVPAFALTPDVDGLRVVRLLSVVGIALLGLLLFEVLRRAGMNRWLAGAAAISVISLPSFQVYAAWSTAFIASYAAISAGFASLLATKAAGARLGQTTPRLAVSAALLLGALLTYQQMAMFFWVFGAIAMLQPSQELARARRIFGSHVRVAIPAMAIGYVVFKVLTHYYGVTNAARGSLAQDVPRKLGWFWHEALMNALNLSVLTPTRTVALGIAALGVVGIPLLHRAERFRLGFVALAVVLALLSYLPSLVTNENWASYRSLGALSALLTVYAWFGLWGIARAAREQVGLPHRVSANVRIAILGLSALISLLVLALVVVPLKHFPDLVSGVNWESSSWLVALAALFLFVAGAVSWATLPTSISTTGFAVRIGAAVSSLAVFGLVLSSSLLAARNVTTLFAKPLHAELTTLRARLADEDGAAIERVTLIRPAWWQSAAPIVRYDEFGYPATSHDWAAQPAVFLVLREEHRLREGLIVDSRPSSSRATRRRPVDMRVLARLRDGWVVWSLRG